MKIFHVITSLANGGAEKFSVELSNEQSQNNEVGLCSVKKIEDWMLPTKKLKKSVKLVVLNIQKKYAISIFIKLFLLLRKEKPQVVHVHSSILMFHLLILSINLKNIRFVQTIHSTFTPGYKKLFDIINKMPLFKKKFIHICISKNIFDIFCSTYPELYFRFINNGICPMCITNNIEKVRMEINNMKLNKNTKVFIAIGNYSYYKNFSMLVKVFKQLQEEKHNVILLIIGKDTSPDQDQYIKVESLRGDNTFLIGLKQNIADYLSCADVLVLSSLMEGMPLVVLEAFSMGVTVVSTPAGGVYDMVKNAKNGFIANDFSEEALYKAVLRFLNASKEEIDKIKKQNKKEFEEKYSMEICKKKYDEIYSEK